MARNRVKLGSLTRQIQNVLDNKLAIGESKHKDKILGLTQDKIYSWGTYKNYLKHCNYFTNYCKEKYNCKKLEECRKYADEWLETRSNLSAYTQKLEVSALAKLYGETSENFKKTNDRKRKNINRSRGEKIRDKHFSEEKNQEFVQFCKSTGLRRAELKVLTGDKLKFKENGDVYIIIDKGSKGGRYREVLVTNFVELVIEKMKRAGTAKVFEKIPNAADIHSYRAEYCTAIYEKFAREIKEIPKQEKYYCRKDLKGVCYDKKAMLIASQMLGHNRISIIAGHYIRQK